MECKAGPPDKNKTTEFAAASGGTAEAHHDGGTAPHVHVHVD